MSPPDRSAPLFFKLDENLPRGAALQLASAGHDVSTVLEQDLSGAADPRVAEVCSKEGRILVTPDRGFGNIREYPPGTHPGIVVLLPESPSQASTIELVERLAFLLESAEPIAGCLWVLDPTRLRVRGIE